MLIYITSGTNENIFDNICNENNIHITKFKNITNLNNFYSKNNFENCKILAVDLSILINTNDEIIDFFLKFRQLYDVKIIIVGIGRKVGDILLSKLVAESIFNFIISEDIFLQNGEIYKCVLGNNDYKDCVKFKVLEQEQPKENNKRLDMFKDFLGKINKPKLKKDLTQPIKEEIKSKVSAVQKENEQLKVSIENSLNLSSVAKAAEDKLGMQKLDNNQKIYLDLQKKDYVEPASEEVIIDDNISWFERILNTLTQIIK